MASKKVKQELVDRYYIGVVEDNVDPKRKGRIKVRIERLHGRKDADNSIPTEHIPWAVPSIGAGGSSYGVPSLNKIVYVSHIEGDFYSPEYWRSEHYNINLQEKLQSLDDDGYTNFYAMTYDDRHQYYHEKGEGVIFDFVKSNMAMRENGDIQLNLRDNQSKLFLGTEDANQQAVLGNHWMDWFDEFIQNLIGSKGGPYLGNMGAPVIPNPGMIEVLNKYLALRETFLSDHVFIVDDNRVKTQDRQFDLEQHDDNYNDENLQQRQTAPSRGYQPEERKPGADTPKVANVPPNTASDNMTSSKLPIDATPDDIKKTLKPFDEPYKNGEIPLEKLTINSRLSSTFPDSSDERKYLLDAASKSLTNLLDSYDSEKDNAMPNITLVKGYHNLDRQTTIREQFPTSAPIPGKDPFGFANQVEIWFDVKKSDVELVNNIKELIRSKNLRENATPQERTLDWLLKNSKKYKWNIAGRTSTGDVQWWHWIYDPTIDTVNNLLV
jgi:hypothetical protein